MAGYTSDTPAFEALPGKLAPVLRAEAVNLWCSTTNLDTVSISNFGLDEGQLNDYLENWIHRDTLVSSTVGSGLGFGEAATPESHFGASVYRDLPVVEGFYRPNNIEHQMARFDTIDSGWLMAVTAQRGNAEAPMGADDLRHLDILAHHLNRAWLIAIRTGLLSLQAEATDMFLARCRLATWLLTGQRHVLAQNTAAETLATGESGILLTNGQFRFAHPQLDAALLETLRCLESGTRRPVELPLPADVRGRFAWGMVIPVEDAGHTPGFLRTAYMLVLARPGTETPIRWDQLHQRLPITPSEADVLARLMQGADLRDIADERGSAYETVRAQEKSLRGKLACDTRGALLARGWRAITAMPDFTEPGT